MRHSLITELAERHRGITDPEDFLTGVKVEGLLVPDSVLVFNRWRDRGRVDRVTQSSHRLNIAVNLEGRGDSIVDGLRLPLDPGHCVLIFPHQHHRHVRDDRTFSWLLMSFELDEYEALEPLRNTPVPVPPICWEYIELLTREYSQEKGEPAHRTILLIALILNELVKHAPRHERPKKRQHPRATVSALIDRANLFIRGHLYEDLSVERVAKHCGYSPSHFRALYRKRMGLSLGTYIREMRISRAQELLGSTDLNITEIAYAVGYGSVYAFSQAFKKMTGTSPLKYRQALGRRV
jgi:AraC-like DNA-binding protein